MSNEKLYDIIRSPIITEKSTTLSQYNKVLFKVRADATKQQVQKAVEKIFNVKVIDVNTINIPGKSKVFRGKQGRRSDIKKAIVTLAEGQTIDIAAGA